VGEPQRQARHDRRPRPRRRAGLSLTSAAPELVLPDLRQFASHEEAAARFRLAVPERLNVFGLIARHAESDAPAAASIRPGGDVETATFRQLVTASARIAAALRELGVAPGDRIAVVLPNTIECNAVQLGILRTGAAAALLRQHSDVDAYRHELAAVDPAVVFCETARLSALRELVRPGTRFVASDAGAWRAWVTDAGTAEAGDLLALLRDGGADESVADTSADDPAVITFTSGSTGASKAVVQPHRSYLAVVPSFQMYSSLAPHDEDFFFTSLGLSSAGGLRVALPAWGFGCPISSTAQPLDTRELCEMLTRLRVTCAYLGPDILRTLRGLDGVEDLDWSALRTITYSGEAIGEELQAWLESRLGVELSPYYGASETAFLTSGCGAWFRTPPGATGKAVPGRDFAVLDEDTHEPVAAGAVGIVSVRLDDPGMFLGYRRPETGEITFGEGVVSGDWFLLNDLARFDEEGQLRYVGRRGQVLQDAEGTLVPPTDVEDAVLGPASIGEVVAMQLADERALTVCVTPGAAYELDEVVTRVGGAIAQRFGDRLAVGRLIVLADVPRTAGTRKINRRLLREQLEGGTAALVADLRL
jgi:acetyl-CoA synthetase